MDRTLLPECPVCGGRQWVHEIIGDGAIVQYGPDGEEVLREEGQPGTDQHFSWFRCISPACVDGDTADDETTAILEALVHRQPRVWFPQDRPMTPPDTSTRSADRLSHALPDELRPFIRVDSAVWPPAMLEEIAASMAEAGRRIAAVLRPDRTCNVVFGKRPFNLTLGNGQLVFTPLDHVVQARVNSIIFIDAERLVSYEPVLRVAMLLEEFVHVLMAVESETVVMAVVAALYPEIAVVDGRYVAAPR